MSKKVLILSTSPRIGGNSDILAGEFARVRRTPEKWRRSPCG